MYLAPHLFGISAILVLPMLPRTREVGGGDKMKHHVEKPVSVQRTNNTNGHVHKRK